MSDTRRDLTAYDDEAFVKAAEMQIWLSAYANNNPRAPAHKEADKGIRRSRAPTEAVAVSARLESGLPFLRL